MRAYSDSEALLRIIKKKAYHDTGKQVKAYYQTHIPKRMKQVFQDSFEAHRQFKSLHFVFDRNILSYLVDNIRYFYSINLITRQDVSLIRKDIARIYLP